MFLEGLSNENYQRQNIVGQLRQCPKITTKQSPKVRINGNNWSVMTFEAACLQKCFAFGYYYIKIIILKYL